MKRIARLYWDPPTWLLPAALVALLAELVALALIVGLGVRP